MNKLLFVDFDNVLAVTLFNKDKVGMSQQDWIEWCVNHQNHSYDECISVPFMKELLETEKANNTKLFVLTAVFSSYEADSKRCFCKKYYDGLFDEFIAVGSSKDKIDIIKAVAKREKVSLSDCEMIEDDYSLLLMAYEEGIKATHIIKLASCYYERKNKKQLTNSTV